MADNQNVVERHAQTVISLLIVALLTWTGKAVTDLRESNARMEERMTAMARQIDDLRGSMDDRYRKEDAERDFGVVSDRIGRLEQRVERLEGKH